MCDTEFVAFDLETTGLHPSFCQIVEIGAVRFLSDGTEVSRMTELVDPGCSVPAGVVEIHGITDAMLLGKPRIEEVLPKFEQILGSPDTILMAHNALFDIRFLSFAFSRHRFNIPENMVVDTLKLSRLLLPQIPNHRLETVSRHLHVSEFTEHRAIGDALDVKAVFLQMLEHNPAIGIMDNLFNCIQPLFFEEVVPVTIDVPKEFDPLVAAIEIQQSIFIVYEGGTKGRRKRKITPRSLIESRGNIYVIALCHIDEMEKHFRLDRILEIE